MYYDEDIFETEDDFREAYLAAVLVTKEDITRSIRLRLMADSWDYGGEREHTEAFRASRRKLAERFLACVEKTRIFDAPEDYWGYSYTMNSTGMELLLEHYDGCTCHGDGTVSMDFIDESFVMLSVRTEMLSADEYAERYGIESATVRQWIRRGKLRTAVKYGREWRIPELTEVPGRGYHMGQFQWEEDLADCPDEFGFLKKAQIVTLRQDEKVKSLYVISYTDRDGERRDKVCTAAEREKVERFLIEHPQVRYQDCLGCYA